jgi:hypothetical protein
MDIRTMTDEEIILHLEARGNPQVRIIEHMNERLKELEEFKRVAIRRFELFSDMIQQNAIAIQQLDARKVTKPEMTR